MAIRITTSTDGKRTTIRLEGRLDAAALTDLRAECDLECDSLRLDLSGLMSADEEAVSALRLLTEQGAVICGASSYIRQLLYGTFRREE